MLVWLRSGSFKTRLFRWSSPNSLGKQEQGFIPPQDLSIRNNLQVVHLPSLEGILAVFLNDFGVENAKGQGAYFFHVLVQRMFCAYVLH